jgi:hypothetical protein
MDSLSDWLVFVFLLKGVSVMANINIVELAKKILKSKLAYLERMNTATPQCFSIESIECIQDDEGRLDFKVSTTNSESYECETEVEHMGLVQLQDFIAGIVPTDMGKIIKWVKQQK